MIELGIFIGIAILMAYFTIKVEKGFGASLDKAFAEKYKPAEIMSINLYGGPMDKKEEKVTAREPFYIIPYPPSPDDEDAQVVGQIGETPLVLPKFAFYQQVMDADYFFRRDLTYEEVMLYTQNKQLPTDLGGSTNEKEG